MLGAQKSVGVANAEALKIAKEELGAALRQKCQTAEDVARPTACAVGEALDSTVCRELYCRISALNVGDELEANCIANEIAGLMPMMPEYLEKIKANLNIPTNYPSSPQLSKGGATSTWEFARLARKLRCELNIATTAAAKLSRLKIAGSADLREYTGAILRAKKLRGEIDWRTGEDIHFSRAWKYGPIIWLNAIPLPIFIVALLICIFLLFQNNPSVEGSVLDVAVR